MCACLVPCAGVGSSYTVCCLSVPVKASGQQITQLPGDLVHPLPLQVQAASTQLSWVVGSTMLAGLHQGFGVLLQPSWVMGTKVCWMTGVLHAGRAAPGVRHAHKLKCYI